MLAIEVYLPTVACALAVACLMRAELRHDRDARIAWKLVASMCFLAVGAVRMPATTFGHLIAVGLAFGVAGDIALLSPKHFLHGLVAFFAGHLCYVLAFATLASAWFGPLSLLPIAASGIALRWLWPHLRTLRLPVIAYVAVITAMLVGAIAAWRAGAGAHPARMLAGTLLFYASDLWVARDKFVTPTVLNKLVGLPLYYGGQLLIAWAIH